MRNASIPRLGLLPPNSVEGDEPMLNALNLSDNEKDMVEHAVTEMERELDTDREAALADMRYTFIDRLCADTVVKCGESKEHARSVKMDNLLTNKYLAIPIFLLIMLLIFWLTFGVIGSFLSDLLSQGIDFVTNEVSDALTAYGINPVVHSLVIDGVFAGVGSVLSFIPRLWCCFSSFLFWEDSGYMARVAFVMDKLLRKIGLSGRSFVPMLIGFGCSVPAIMATRTLSSERDRKMTILLTPFMSCSAKLPIYGMITMAFFPKYRALVMIGLYVLGMVVGVLMGLLLKRTLFHGKPVPFVMELPNYRLPSPKSVGMLLWDKAKDFLTRAFTVIFVATIIIWFLQSFDVRLNPVSAGDDSMLAGSAVGLLPFLRRLALAIGAPPPHCSRDSAQRRRWSAPLPSLTGSNTANMSAALSSIFTPLTAISFLVFTLLYTPCVAAISAVRREMNSGKAAVGVVFLQTGVAWVVAFIVYHIGLLFV